jgi:hypothetical protein
MKAQTHTSGMDLASGLVTECTRTASTLSGIIAHGRDLLPILRNLDERRAFELSIVAGDVAEALARVRAALAAADDLMRDLGDAVDAIATQHTTNPLNLN